MSITFRRVYSDPSSAALDLTVAERGSEVRVLPGTFKVYKEDFELTEEETFALTVRPHRTFVSGYLVQLRSSGEVRLLVDECEQDGSDMPLDWGRNADYRRLATLFRVEVPPNVTSLEGLELSVLRIESNPVSDELRQRLDKRKTPKDGESGPEPKEFRPEAVGAKERVEAARRRAREGQG